MVWQLSNILLSKSIPSNGAVIVIEIVPQRPFWITCAAAYLYPWKLNLIILNTYHTFEMFLRYETFFGIKRNSMKGKGILSIVEMTSLSLYVCSCKVQSSNLGHSWFLILGMSRKGSELRFCILWDCDNSDYCQISMNCMQYMIFLRHYNFA